MALNLNDLNKRGVVTHVDKLAGGGLLKEEGTNRSIQFNFADAREIGRGTYAPVLSDSPFHKQPNIGDALLFKEDETYPGEASAWCLAAAVETMWKTMETILTYRVVRQKRVRSHNGQLEILWSGSAMSDLANKLPDLSIGSERLSSMESVRTWFQRKGPKDKNWVDCSDPRKKK